MTHCFGCNKKFGSFESQVDMEAILSYGKQPPNAMTKHDKICNSCFYNIENIQDSPKITRYKKQGKYEIELPVKRTILTAYVPFIHIFVYIKLGWRYGLSALIISHVTLFSLVVVTRFFAEISGMMLEYGNLEEWRSYLLYAITSFTLALVLHGLIIYFFVKKYNARVRDNKSNIASS